jgi:hypothetical protein
VDGHSSFVSAREHGTGMREPKYPLASLVVAAAFSKNMTDLMTHLGEPMTPGKRAGMWARLGQHGIDTSHWERSPRQSRTPGWTYSPEALAAAVAHSESVAGVLRLLGIKPAGGSHFYIGRRIREAGLDTSHFLGQAHRRNKPGKKKSPQELLVVLPGNSHRTAAKRLTRAMLESGVPHVCVGCGIGPEWLGKALTLAVDHVNGEWLDNRLGNLRFLCPNCHAQTSTWCRRRGS